MRAQVVIPFDTNLPKDVITNTFWFYRDEGATFEQDAIDVAAGLATFYETVYTQGIANYTNPAAAHVLFYNNADPPPRAPYRIDWGSSFDPVTITTIVPTEVAMVLSFQGTQVNGIPQARRRGRVYFGALGAALQMTASSGTTPFFPRWSDTFIASVGNAAALLAGTYGASNPGLQWHVYSPTTQTSTLVVDGWVDNSPDTQRRRSVDANTRDLWNVP